ncbi:WD40 repeat domain-containing protein [Candidatus Uabimicrobium amorphum]|uniref:Anaphase-promoting complex subunit 4-like WD40 domain-containing protein n=1 Tax=Uabimicrobium amorphum TaxID=2596890 RepID=A0A5S9F518_UABAM|nr:PD40 domain-containing protein [Candidatus Uabimicrobium amorphum]BBM86375.1 hypothetical protein UABAM_04761 [Candidatus Uabimicrobium amorphum]
MISKEEKINKKVKELCQIQVIENKFAKENFEEVIAEYKQIVEELPDEFCIEVVPNISVDGNVLKMLVRAFEVQATLLCDHPQSVFQTVWNYGYWYDSPEASVHCPARRVPDSENKLCHVVEYWREQKEIESHKWLKSLRPLPIFLDDKWLHVLRDCRGEIGITTSNRAHIAAAIDNVIHIWKTNGELLYRLIGHEDNITQLEWSDDGSSLISRAYDGEVKIWDAEKGELLHSFSQVKTTFSFSHDGKKVAIVAAKNTFIWDIETKRQLCILTEEKAIRSISWSPDGNKIACAGIDEVTIWDVSLGKKQNTFHITREMHCSICWHPKSEKIACNQEIWSVITGKTLYKIEGIHLSWSCDGRKIASTLDDHKVRVWDGENGELLYILETESHPFHDKMWWEMENVYWSGNDREIIYQQCDRELSVWDVQSKKLLDTSKYSENAHQAKNKYIHAAGDCVVRVWSDQKSNFTCALLGHKERIKRLSRSKNGKYLASIAKRELMIWDCETGIPICSFTTQEIIFNVHWSCDNRKIAVVSEDSAVKVIDIRDEKILYTVEHGQDPSFASWNNNDTMLVTISGDTYFFESSESIRDSVCGITPVSNPFGITFPEQKIPVEKETIKIWDNEGQLVHALKHGEYVKSVMWSEDNKLTSICSNGSVKIWDAQSGVCLEHEKEKNSLAIESAKPERFLLEVQKQKILVKCQKEKKTVAFFCPAIRDVQLAPNNIVTGFLGKNVYILQLCGGW